MRFTNFEIQNFKGIQRAIIPVPKRKKAILALIGLNESGKTTILEAISNFISEDEDVAALHGDVSKRRDVLDFVPKDKKAAFSEKISIAATIELDETDVAIVLKGLDDAHSAKVANGLFPRSVRISRTYTFVDSKLTATNNFWWLEFQGTVGAQRVPRKIDSTSNREVWLHAVKLIGERIPKICYFPSFLFAFPERIYLKEQPNEERIQKVYRQTIEDVLRFSDSKLSIQTHLVDRLEQIQKDAGERPWRALYEDSHTKQIVDAVLQKIQTEVGRTVFTAWNTIFSSKITNKQVTIELKFDQGRADTPYLVFSIYDGPERYSLSERSLGFRWFFSFLLFTKFRSARNGNETLFLFDEPASNLHPRAQMKLLESFSKVIGDSSAIIYSTHSQYMIDPLTLDSALIVQNAAIDYEAETRFDTRPTNIRCLNYRNFVAEHPAKNSYFQPVLDKIAFVHSPLVMPDNVIIVEGKGDFYAYSTALGRIGGLDLHPFPSAGASTMDVQIAMTLGLGKRFIVICDDDKAGRRARADYRDKYALNEKSVVTYADLDAEYADYKLENFLDDDMRELIKQHFGITEIDKSRIMHFFVEAASNPDLAVSPGWMTSMTKLLSKIKDRIEAS